jgi:molybdopterin/thiamine biosynthesis adenylyltransferase
VAKITGYPQAPFHLCITDESLSELRRTVGSRPPETGAKCFGPKDHFGIDVVEFDERGSAGASFVVYSPDTQWGAERQRHHLDQPDDQMRLWTGDVHSHPGRGGHPSSKSGQGLGDMGYVEEVFRENPPMEWFMLPIFTLDDDEIVIFPWIVQRGRNGSPPALHVAELKVCPASEFPLRIFNPEWEATLGKETSSMPKQETDDGMFSVLRRRYMKRAEGFVSPAFHEKAILVVGVGAGSLLTTKLARFSPGRLVLCDPDRCEIENLCRTDYTFEDAERGALKIDAVARRIAAINPTVKVECHARSIEGFSLAECRNLMEGVDLVIAGTDAFPAQARCNELAATYGVPSVFIGLHAGAAGGRIIWAVPDQTGCYRCAAAERYSAAEQGQTDALKLPAAPGILVDCQFIDIVALKICLALLERGQASRLGEFFRRMGNRNEVVCRTDPDYAWGGALWDAVLADLPTQPKPYAKEIKEQVLLAMDTLWFQAPRNPDCPVCGRHHRKEASP